MEKITKVVTCDRCGCELQKGLRIANLNVFGWVGKEGKNIIAGIQELDFCDGNCLGAYVEASGKPVPNLPPPGTRGWTPAEKTLTTRQAADLLGMTANGVLTARHEKKLTSVGKAGKEFLFAAADVLAFHESRQNRSKTPTLDPNRYKLVGTDGQRAYCVEWGTAYLKLKNTGSLNHYARTGVIKPDIAVPRSSGSKYFDYYFTEETLRAYELARRQKRSERMKNYHAKLKNSAEPTAGGVRVVPAIPADCRRATGFGQVAGSGYA